MANFLDVMSPRKAAIEAIQKAIETREAIKFGEATSSLHAQVRAAYESASAVQERESALREENETLKRRLMEFDGLEARKARYEMKRLHPGITICALKEGMDDSRDPQQACYACYERGMIRALQSGGVKNGIERLHCNECNTVLRTGTLVAPQVSTLRTRGPW